MSKYLHEIDPESAREALRIAERVREQVATMAPMIDDKPGRNLRWEVGRDIDRVASLVGDGFPAGRVLIALSLELAQEFGTDLTSIPDEFGRRQRETWELRLSEMGIGR